jgi:hypothetical protein
MSRTNNTRHLRNVKHVGNVEAIRHNIDTFLRDFGKNTSHHTGSTITNPPSFNPSRTGNPAVAEEWEARVAKLHAKVKIFRKSAGRKHLSSRFDPAPVASFARARIKLALTYGAPAYEIVHHPDNSITVWYHPEGQADRYSTQAYADAHSATNAARVIPDLKREAFEAYEAVACHF